MARPIDRSTIDRLFVDHLPVALRFAMRLSGDPHAAEDVVQEALLRVLRQWPAYRGEASFRTWLLQIVLNGRNPDHSGPVPGDFLVCIHDCHVIPHWGPHI